MTARRKTAKRKSAKRSAKKVAKRKVKKKAARRKAKKKVGKKKRRPIPSGYSIHGESRLLLPTGVDQVPAIVETSSLTSGVKTAKKELQRVIGELKDIADGFDLTEVSLEVSFSADGKFLGVGVGGATSIGLKLTPSED